MTVSSAARHSTYWFRHSATLAVCLLVACSVRAADDGADVVAPDIVVAADGTGDFKTIQAAIESIPRDNRERTIVLVKNGVYNEKLRIEADCITLRGESREGVRIEDAAAVAVSFPGFFPMIDELRRASVVIEDDRR